MNKKMAYFVFLLCLCIGAARFSHHQTKGFRIAKIQDNLMSLSSAHPSPEDIRYIRSLFAYKFRYYGRGKQSFVFLSDDGEHVIKIFNNSHQSKAAFFKALSPLPYIGGWAASQQSLFESKLKNIFTSYTIAFDEMRDKTGLLFTHLSATDSLPPLTIVDTLNISHRLNTNTLGFLIQKKAQLAYPFLEELIQAHDIEGAKRALLSLLDLFLWKYQHGIHDNDPLIRTNFGFLDGKAIQIDVGPLSKDASMQDPETMRAEILRITASLKHWLQDKSPELLLFLNGELKKRLDKTTGHFSQLNG